MKKIILYTSVVGLAIGVVAYLLRKNKSKDSKIQPIDNDFGDLRPNNSDKGSANEANIVEEMTDVKSSSAHSIHDRHTGAADIMCDAFKNIYKDIEPVVYDEKKVDSIIAESVLTNNELDSLSDELDDLLK